MDYSDKEAITWPFQLTQGLHRQMYPFLEPSRPEYSAQGRKVMITGVTGVVGRVSSSKPDTYPTHLADQELQRIAEAWCIAHASVVIITGRKQDVLNEVATEIRSISPETKVIIQPAELTDEDSVAKLWTAAAAEAGTVDVLINDAATMNYAPVGDLEPTEWWRDFEVNVKGSYLMSHYFLFLRKHQKY